MKLLPALSLLLATASLVACGGVETPSGPGAQTYLRYCYSCHAAGIAGAPKVGFRDQWASRAEPGLEHLLKRTIMGVQPGMPPRGGCRECTDEELAAAIEHMLALSGLSYDDERGQLTEVPP